ncbi:MAG: trypsin-like peptidase domain-containing protein, partial [Planctomycetota bacterium]
QAVADDNGQTAVLTQAPLDLSRITRVQTPGIDLSAVALEDEQNEAQGLPVRFAIPNPVQITPETDGTWTRLDDDTLVWQLRITCPDALSVNLGFARYNMPAGGQLLVYATDKSYSLRPYTEWDNKAHGELWTPVVLSDDIIVEVRIPEVGRDELELELTSINHGYRVFGEVRDDGAGPRQGYCNIDVICPEGDGWRDDIQSVAAIQRSGSMVCTGFMVNNTAEDQTPYFMTAYHCGVTSSTDSTLVCYWNFQSPNCGDLCCGSLSTNQSGSTFLAAYSSSDFTLVLLDDDPDPSWNITFAGWSNSSANPSSAVAIHHPGVDEKAISFENDPCTTTSYLGTSTPGDGTHVRVIDWDLGTTEGGSSGSPLFDQNHHVVGQLHGGYAACGNNESDWYGRFSVSWSHGLSTYLDPISSGATTLDTLVPGAEGLKVTPTTGLESAGDPGGPFSPISKVYTIENQGATGFNYSVTKNVNWLTITNGSGYLSGYGTTNVTVSINSNANSLSVGTYNDTVSFTNLTSGVGDTSRQVELQVGGPQKTYEWTMDTNPGWSTQGQWAWGQPTGGGSGEYGSLDPSSGYTGNNVYGYNLSGDYANNINPAYYLTSTAIDCTDLISTELRFRRWLGVETANYDHAAVQVSNNGSTWTTLWENPSGSSNHTDDGAWTQQTYNISAVADNQPTLYIRWAMGTTDSSWTFCGWNIDDVEIWAIDTAGPTCADGYGNMDGIGGVDGNDIQNFVTCYLSDDPGTPGCACADMYPGTPNGTFEIEDVEAFVDCLLGITCP